MQTAAARKAEAEAQRAQAEAEREKKKKEARDLQRQRRQEMQRQQQLLAEKAAEQAEAEAAAATAAAAVAVVDDLDDGNPMQGAQQLRRQQQPAQTQQPRATAAAFEPHAPRKSRESSSYTAEVRTQLFDVVQSAVDCRYWFLIMLCCAVIATQVLARLDKDLLIAICLQAEEQRRIALTEQMAASDAAAKATNEVAQLRQTVAVLQQAIVSLPQQPLQHMHVHPAANTGSYTEAYTGLQPQAASSMYSSGHVGMGMGGRAASTASDIYGNLASTAGASGGTIGVGVAGYSHQPMPQPGYRQW